VERHNPLALPPSTSDRLIKITLTMGQYPMLRSRIRARLRRELFERGLLDPQTFEQEVGEKAILSQDREGLYNPLTEEASDAWELRLHHIREFLTDFYFSHHLSVEIFERLVREVLSERGLRSENLTLSINPELAPLDIIFEQARSIEAMTGPERAKLEPRLRESKVVLIRSIISDQLAYINIAKEWFTIADLAEIRRRKIGPGRIGGKAAGMLLAARILNEVGSETLRSRIRIPESYFLGSDVLYMFMALNNLVHWNDQKYKPEDQMRAEYPQIERDFMTGHFPPEIEDKLLAILANIGTQPVIVRSSSLLEDNFGTSFAGKYESYFCPNQGSLQENLHALMRGIARIYSTTLNPNALLYRRSKGLQDYDERMAVLIQVVRGETFGRYFLPSAAGVAFSRNMYRWSPQIRPEEGFVRLVWGLGTRAVDRVGNDYPRLVALSHPNLRPSASPTDIRRYSQMYVDLIDLQDNEFKTLPIGEVLEPHYPALRYIAQTEQDGYFSSLRTNVVDDPRQLVLTFDDFIRRTPFAPTMREILVTLEQHYHSPVDLEFTAQVVEKDRLRPDIEISLIQCRPQSQLRELAQVQVPANLPSEDVVFSTHFMVPVGHVPNIRYVLYAIPEGYFGMRTQEERAHLSRAIGQLNAALAKQTFICMGPGRWGTSNPDLGVYVNYGDIYNARALVELTGKDIGLAPEPSFGTHFFQDLIEAQIYPLAIYLDDPETLFNRDFFYSTRDRLTDWLPNESRLDGCLKLIKVEDFRLGHHLELVMNDEKSLAVAYLAPG
jgi:hypothetical protein